MIKLSFKDQKVIEVEDNLNSFQISSIYNPRHPEKIIAARLNGKLIDATQIIKESGEIEFITKLDKESFAILNHSAAHLMANAIKEIFKDVSFGVGPSIEEGFYYDFKIENSIKEEDLGLIEKKMKEIAKSGLKIKKEVVSKKEALEIFKNDKYKIELINELVGEITIYRQGDFVDLCLGPHLASTEIIKHFKLLNIAGSYWRGNSNNDTLQRIYGVAFFSDEELKRHLELLEERKQRDHRKIGKEQKLFMFNPLSGQGLPIWLPNGMIIRQEMQDYITKLERKYQFHHVSTPVLGSVDLYKTSGHWEHYKENMFAPIEMENETLVLRPMSCPHHTLIYKNELRSYRDLPLRLAEQVLQHRYEASGALTGMERVRAMTLTDSHIFCTIDQVRQEFSHALKLILHVLKDFNIEVNYYRLSLHDENNKEKYFNNPEMWEKSEKMLRDVLDENKIDYIEAVGEAAFYGPKLDIQVKTILGHDITMSTLQLDFLLPERFDLTYINEEGTKSRPVMIHRGLIGTYERFLAILIEQNKGVFPTWLAPLQVIILPVASVHNQHASKLNDYFIDLDIRAKVDDRNEKLGYRLREAQVSKVPYSLVIGDNEIENGLVTYRPYGSNKQVTVKLEEFVSLLSDEIKSKRKSQ